ncbi:MAG: HAMP domain-containing histidine kinase [Phycisphaerales bacterium]|nr:HAMP domain-containing histidine kinase [Phycisphaerales bacterium]
MPQPNPPQHPSSPDPPHRPHKESADRVLRRTLVKPAGIVPDPVDSAYVANRLTALTHELANLLEGSLRLMSVARRNLNGAAGPASEPQPGQVARNIETVYAAMLQMADLVRNSMAGLPPSPGGAEGMRHALGASGTVASAVRHAANVMLPVAEEAGVELRTDIGPELEDVAAGPIYGLITNTVRNAIESIDRCGGKNGRVDVRAWMEAGRTGRCVGIEVCDDGEGPPARSNADARKVFDYGVTGKHNGAGIGLALCRDVVEQLGGTIELIRRPDGQRGAALIVRYPAPAPLTERRLG